MENLSINIVIQSNVNLPNNAVWEIWISENHIVNWNYASADWCCPRAENNLTVGGIFNYRMEAKDGSMGFDFRGMYVIVEPFYQIVYVLEDGRKVTIDFMDNHQMTTTIIVNFEAETTNDVELQRQGWQAILNSFKAYAEQVS